MEGSNTDVKNVTVSCRNGGQIVSDGNDCAVTEESCNDDLSGSHQQQATLLNGGWTVETEKKGPKPSLFKHSIKTAFCGWFKKELITQLKLSFPIILTWLFQNLLAFVSLVFVGHISGTSIELDSVALATSFINVTGLSIGIGLSSAADTLCSQTYGSKNYKRVGHILQQGILILLVVCLFVWGSWLNTDNLLLVLQQPPCISRYAGYYTTIFTLCLPAFFVYVMIQKYLQSQSRVWPFIVVGLLSNILNVILHAVLLLVLDLGVIGAAIAMVISNISQPVFLIIYIKILKLHKQTWGGWSWESLNNWWEFLKLGIPGMAMICLEWISYEIAVFVLGSIGEVELAINSILINVLVLMFMIPLGLSITSGIRVGNALGAGNPTEAKRAAYISLLLVVINSILQLIFLHCIKNVIGSVYTREEAVLEKIPIVINIITPGLFFDQVQLVIQGILRGCGLQTIGALINFVVFYFFGLPLGISLAFRANMGVIGVWIGLMSATTIQCVIYMIIVLQLNWKKQSQKARKRAGQNDINDNQEEERNEKEEDISLSELEEEECDESDDTDKILETEEFMKNEEHVKETVPDNQKHVNRRRHLKLLLSKTGLFVVGAMFVVVAGACSRFEIPQTLLNGNYTECSDDNSTFNDDFSSTIIILPSPSPSPYW